MRSPFIAFAVLSGITFSASAAAYELRPGNWQFQEGLGVSDRNAGQSSRTFCVKADETEADIDWFTNLAKPRNDCTTRVLSQSSAQIRLEFSCPMSGTTLKGPSTIQINENTITIQNDLALDLPYAPLPMGQTKTVRHISSRCTGY